MAKVEYQNKTLKFKGVKMIETTKGYCSNCGAAVEKNQYGADEECPNCNKLLDWENEHDKEDSKLD